MEGEIALPLYQIAVLAVVQGIFEFLPISAWGHLIMVPALLGWAYDFGSQIDLAVHVGTLLAVVLYFRREMLRLVRGGVLLALGRMTNDGRLLLLLLLATVPVVVAFFIVRDQAEVLRQSYTAVAFAMIGFGLLLYAVDAAFMQIRRIEHLSALNALILGLAQVIALLPGTSRAGITMTAGRFLGFERAEAARFSLLMSIPVGFGQGALAVRDAASAGAAPFGAAAVLAGALAFVTAVLAIRFLMAWLKRASFGIFAVYRVLAGAGILYWYYVLRVA
jgi:undecaprenyl-diphosphatase